MTAHTSLKPRPLLRKAFPPNGLSARENELLAILDQVIEADIAPAASAHDEQGRYPTKAVAALKRSGVLNTAVPAAYGGPAFSSRFSLEVQVRLSIADSAVAQIFKIHDELTREVFVYSPAEFRPALARKLSTTTPFSALQSPNPAAKSTTHGKRSQCRRRRRLFDRRTKDLHHRRRRSRLRRGLGIQSAGRRRCRKSIAWRAG